MAGKARLTDTAVSRLPVPAKGNRIFYDGSLPGFGVRVTAGGTRAFILNYRTELGQERRFTIGQCSAWKVAAARAEAQKLKRRVDNGGDPLGEVQEKRDAPTVADLCQWFADEYLPSKRPSTQQSYRHQIAADILPALGNRKVAAITYDDIAELHRTIGKRAPIAANRVCSLLSRMFNLGIKWRWCASNPVRGLERNQENKRRRYLSADELLRLTKALDKHPDQQAANAVRLLLLTGARRGEVLNARWGDFNLHNLASASWSKPGATTKQKTDHQVPLSDAAYQLLVKMRSAAPDGAEHLFPGRDGKARGQESGLRQAWADLCKAAKIDSVRLHDLRHTYASTLASAGLSLPIIGALLGHTQPATTQRYAHLFDDPLRAATQRAADIITGKPSGKISNIRERA